MRHTSEQLITAIDRHAPKGWRRSSMPEPRILVLPEIESFVLSSLAFSQGHLWNEAWADPEVGFPIMAARPAVRAYLTAHPDRFRGVIHFGHGFMNEIAQMIQVQAVPDYLVGIVQAVRGGADDVFQAVELIGTDYGIRLRFVD
ncbi:hypothetical protein HZA87_02130 [Candidatus Uhrbacteria bacterium]|nr:hypothetical protein [Candidatus Uhrbacteria bacterium]